MTVMIKACLAGDSHVGKTSIVKRYLEDVFNPDNVKPTIGLESNPTVEIDSNNGSKVTISIWDTAGQEQYRALAPMFFRNANVALLVGSYDDTKSIKNLTEWQNLILDNSPNCKFILVINKSDLEAADGITEDYIMDIGRITSALEIFKTSAKTGQCIKELFQYIADSDEIEADKQYLQKLDQEDKEFLDQKPQENSNGCC